MFLYRVFRFIENFDTTTADLEKTSTIDLTASPPIPVNNVTTDPSFNSTEAPATPCQSHMDCPFFQCCARYVYSYYLHSKSRSSTVYFRCHVCLACWLYNPTITSVWYIEPTEYIKSCQNVWLYIIRYQDGE